MGLSGILNEATGAPEPLPAPPQPTFIKSMERLNFKNAIFRIVVKDDMINGALEVE